MYANSEASGNSERFFQWKSALPDPIGQCWTFHELHHQVVGPDIHGAGKYWDGSATQSPALPLRKRSLNRAADTLMATGRFSRVSIAR